MPLVKRYANRKLYDTVSKRYVTLDDLAAMIRRGEEVKVVDHVTGEDLTSVTLFQVIFEEEKKIGGLLPQVLLSRLIRMGGETVSALRSRLGSIDPFQLVDEEIRRRVQELAAQERVSTEEAQRMLDLLLRRPTEAVQIPVQGEPEDEVEVTAPEPQVDPEAVAALQRQVEQLEQELDRLLQARGSAQAKPPDVTAVL